MNDDINQATSGQTGYPQSQERLRRRIRQHQEELAAELHCHLTDLQVALCKPAGRSV